MAHRYSPASFYLHNPLAVQERYVQHAPLSRELFFVYRDQQFPEKKAKIITLKNRYGKRVFVPDFNTSTIEDMKYVDMLKRFMRLNKAQTLTPFLAYHIWAGIAFNVFHFEAWTGQIWMIRQVRSRSIIDMMVT